jgi:tetrahydromethanopterin S-methyltransferase subunit G
MISKFEDYPIPEAVLLASIAELNNLKQLVDELEKSIALENIELAKLVGSVNNG